MKTICSVCDQWPDTLTALDGKIFQTHTPCVGGRSTTHVAHAVTPCVAGHNHTNLYYTPWGTIVHLYFILLNFNPIIAIAINHGVIVTSNTASPFKGVNIVSVTFFHSLPFFFNFD